MAAYQPTGIKKIFHDTRRFFAKNWLRLQPALQIGITGSQGKTNTTKIASEVTKSLGSTITTDINLDTSFNVPITALKVKPWTKYIVWELGIDHPDEMDQHLQIAKPQIGIMTGISPVHTDAEHMGSLDILIKEKRKLIEALPEKGYAILNYDDINVRSMATYTKAKPIWYGTNPDFCTAWTNKEHIQIDLNGTHVLIHHKDESFTIKTKLIGTFHAYNILAGYLLLKLLTKKQNLALDYQSIIDRITPLRGRMNIESGPFGTVLLNDSLRANPASTVAGLESLNQMLYTTGRKIAVIGEMGELEHPEEEHRKTGELLAQLKLDYVLCIGPLRKFTINEAIKSGFPADRISYADDVFKAAEELKSILKPGDLWYLKGSLLRNYKRIVQLLNNEKVCCHEIICPYSHCGYPETA